ncbi:MAG: UDP-N-acetylglucosamine 1-carboxyvinyltransferase [Candidatus Aminicenantia bacterium]
MKLRILGAKPLKGVVEISGAKNSALPAISATILTEKEVTLKNIPRVRDVEIMLEIIGIIGGDWRWEGDNLSIKVENIKNVRVPYELVSKMRASILVLGPLVARAGRAEVPHPGGCDIGPRPVDLHVEGLKALGVEIEQEHGLYIAKANKLKGNRFIFSKKSVTGTENLLMASVAVNGEVELINCALEPEVEDLAKLLQKLGAELEGIGSEKIIVRGNKKLFGATHPIIPDRIETGTYMVLGSFPGNNFKIKKAEVKHVVNLIEKLNECGIEVESGEDWIKVKSSEKILPGKIETAPYPGFPTDMQAQFTTLLTQAEGVSEIKETIFPFRFHHAYELLRMGAKIEVNEGCARIFGKTELSGTDVSANDLRASASLVIAGLIAKRETIIHNIHHLERGYEKIIEKLQALGAEVEKML